MEKQKSWQMPLAGSCLMYQSRAEPVPGNVQMLGNKLPGGA